MSDDRTGGHNISTDKRDLASKKYINTVAFVMEASLESYA